MTEKPLEYYIGIAAAAIFVYFRSSHLPHLSRAIYAGISGGLGYAGAPEIAAFIGAGEVMTAIVLTAFGYFILDLGAGILTDRALWRGALRGWLGSKDRGGNDGSNS